MNCKKVLSRLHAYLDGELPATLMREMEAHLGSCPSCSNQAERIRQMDVVLDSFTVPPLPQGFSTRVMAEARRRAWSAPERRPFPGVGWLPLRWLADLTVPMRLAACAMVLIASLLGLFMSRDLSSSGSPQASVAAAEYLDGLEWFSPTPPSSLSSAYLTLALTTPEDQGAR
jgi:anti-sigma factor RsiW